LMRGLPGPKGGESGTCPAICSAIRKAISLAYIQAPVMLGEDCFVPPLLRPLARRGIDEVEAIVEALLCRKAKPIPARPPEHGRLERVLISLRRDGGAGLKVALRIGAQVHGEAVLSALPKGLAAAQAAFLKGFRHGLRRDHAEAQRQSYEAQGRGAIQPRGRSQLCPLHHRCSHANLRNK